MRKRILFILMFLSIALNTKASNDSIYVSNIKYEILNLKLPQEHQISYTFGDGTKRKKSLNEPFIWAGAAIITLCLSINVMNHVAYRKNSYNDQSLTFTEIRKETRLTLLNIQCITITTGLVFYHYIYNF